MNIISQNLMMYGHNYLGIEFSEFAALCRSGENMLILGKSGTSFYKLYEFTEGSVTQAIWSQDGIYLCAFGTTSGFHIFKRTGNSFVKTQTLFYSGYLHSAFAFCPNDELAIRYIYNTETGYFSHGFLARTTGSDTFSNYFTTGGNLGLIPRDASTNICAWSQSGTYVTTPAKGNQSLYIYKKTGDYNASSVVLTQLGPGGSMPIAEAINGNYIYQISASTPSGYYYFSWWKINPTDDVRTFLGTVTLSTSLSYVPKSLKVSSDGTYIIVGMNTNGNVSNSGVFVFKRSTDTITDITASQAHRLFGESPSIEISTDGTKIYTTGINPTEGAKLFTKSGDNLFSSYVSQNLTVPMPINASNTLHLWPSAIYSS
jgi:hypothetical protein